MPKKTTEVIDSPSIRWLIWIYVALLMFEGVLRKWVLPGLSDPLLVVREPFLVLIYLMALGRGAFPLNRYVSTLIVLGAIAAFTGITVGSRDPLVTAYGFDSMFFHLPLAFIIPKVMTQGEVVKIGRFLLLLTIPMAVLMVMQFRSSPDAIINCGAAGGIGSQMRGALGRIRPPGFFTFITGASQFLALASAFAIFGLWRKGIYTKFLIIAAGMAIAISAMVSTSRLALGSIGMVFVMVGVVVAYDRKSMNNVLGMLVPIGLVLVVVTNLDIFDEGREVFEARLQEAGDSGVGLVGTATNWTARAFGDFYGGFLAIKSAPILGAGLGVGTNVGARVLSGSFGFLLAEGEWARVVLEIGPILAMPYLAIRILICVLLFTTAVRGARAGNALPMLLFGSCAMLMLNGQFSQTSTLGFAVVGAGLCLASVNLPREIAASGGSSAAEAPSPELPRGRSPYAATLHGDKPVVPD